VIAPLEQIKTRVEAAVPGAQLGVVANGSPSAQHSLLVDNEHAVAVAKVLRDDAELRLDYASNVTGIDWLDTVIKETSKVKKVVDGVEKEIDQVTERKKPGYLEVVYHLYSMELKHGPVRHRLRRASGPAPHPDVG
jgi:NADH-quinone oxidoreductase subunit C